MLTLNGIRMDLVKEVEMDLECHLNDVEILLQGGAVEAVNAGFFIRITSITGMVAAQKLTKQKAGKADRNTGELQGMLMLKGL